MDAAVSEGSTIAEPAPGRSSVATGPDRPVNAARTVPSLVPSRLDPDTPVDRLAEVPDPELLADLDHPNLVLSPGYIGPERRHTGWLAGMRRTVVGARRIPARQLSLVATTLVAAGLVLVALVGVHTPPAAVASAFGSLIDGSPVAHTAAPGTTPHRTSGRLPGPTAAQPTAAQPTAGPAAASADPTTTVPAASTPAATPTTTPTATTTPTSGSTPAPASSTAAATTLTPAQLGAEALTLVRYPWQRIPGYSIEFLPIGDAPSPGFYGNTTFTWGKAGGTSVLYVYPGETVQHLAGITAFEIGHEVDAAAVEPQGGEQQIEDLLGIHPSSWAPDCDCAEQGYLSGWYAAAFSAYWSPGVGAWSTVAPLPAGATLDAMVRWLDPTIP